jgi:PilZ domain-containing protein
LNDPTKERRSDRVEMALPVRVRGMSNQNKFFDEAAETILISKNGFMTRLRARVDLDSEVHVTNLKNQSSGTFRAAWISDTSADGFHSVGLELIEAEEGLWGVHFPAAELAQDEVAAEVWLSCRRCGQKLLTSVPEADVGDLTKGSLIARICEKCKVTTTWEIATEGAAQPATEAGVPRNAEPSPEASPSGAADSGKASTKDLRKNGRVPMKMRVKVTRHKFGIEMEDICETVNVSRHGVYFLTAQYYEIGETVEVVLPYKKGDLAMHVPGRVVRTDTPQDSPLLAVAVHLQQERPGAATTGAPGGKR